MIVIYLNFDIVQQQIVDKVNEQYLDLLITLRLGAIHYFHIQVVYLFNLQFLRIKSSLTTKKWKQKRMTMKMIKIIRIFG